MTPEELDEARAREAERRIPWREQSAVGVAQLAARLARENWRPIDPGLIEAREIVRAINSRYAPIFAGEVGAGRHDNHIEVEIALAAIKRGRELAQSEGPR